MNGEEARFESISAEFIPKSPSFHYAIHESLTLGAGHYKVFAQNNSMQRIEPNIKETTSDRSELIHCKASDILLFIRENASSIHSGWNQFELANQSQWAYLSLGDGDGDNIWNEVHFEMERARALFAR